MVVDSLAALNGRLYADADCIITDSNKTVYAQVFKDDGTPVCSGPLKLEYKADADGAPEPMVLTLYDGHADGWAQTGVGGIKITNQIIVDRAEYQDMSNAMTVSGESGTSPSIVHPDGLYVLEGWATSPGGDVVVDASLIKVEGLIYEAFGSDEKEGASEMTFYAVYYKTDHKVYIHNDVTTGGTSSLEWTFAGAQVRKDGAAVIRADATEEIAQDSFGILRIQRLDSATASYKYAITVSSSKDGTFVSGTDGVYSGLCKIEMLSKGVYKISEVEGYLYIKISVEDEAVVTGYAFYIDYAKNGTDGIGQAALSLDLHDCVSADGSTIKMNGTVYKVTGSGDDAVRTYSSLSLRESDTYTPYVDGTSKAGEDGRLSNGTMTLAGGDESLSGGSVYDLTLVLSKDGETACSIYAVQGEWCYDGTDCIKTPWAQSQN